MGRDKKLPTQHSNRRGNGTHTATVTLSTGVILKVRSVSPFIIRESVRSIKRPPIPKQWIDDKGREEENPQHPAYLQALEDYNDAIGIAVTNCLVTMGTEIVSRPEGFDGPDDTEWVDVLESADVTDIPTEGRKRYLKWVRLWAVQTSDDLSLIMSKMRELSGVPEEAVLEAAESFRS
jgi:hypothetical protein